MCLQPLLTMDFCSTSKVSEPLFLELTLHCPVLQSVLHLDSVTKESATTATDLSLKNYPQQATSISANTNTAMPIEQSATHQLRYQQ